MFVSPSSNCLPSFLAKPKPLQPIFTFVQSQSYMNLGMEALDRPGLGISDETWERAPGSCLEAAGPAKPQTTYKSPVQRLGEVLRIPQAGGSPTLQNPSTDLGQGTGARESGFPPPTPQSSPQLQSFEDSAAFECPNHSYRLLPGGNRSPTRNDLRRDWDGCSGRRVDDAWGEGTVSSPASRAQLLASQNNGYFAGTSLLSSLFSSNPRTRAPFKPQKGGRGTHSWQLKQYAEATLGSGSLRKAVKLPEGEDKDEWLAVNVVDFYNQINLLYGGITEFCSPQSCPEMKATDEFEYLWQDSENYKKPTKMPAPEYIEHLMAWVQSNIDNEQMFPSRIGVPFPKTFPALLRNIFKRLYRVYAHIYCHHYPVIIELGLEPHLNTSFKHYVLFIDEHGLASGSKDFWGPLGDLVENMLRSD
ncbi:hypothetical protein K491DRAFT_717483 [Lophiostoma macrostomum CBS 122681]|uniref:Maintenance of ploidy protein MOB2 n=1 Tax=Lophiostoma macrostomum CBS 122681 TaxID=1314788 RepID=A0A6A6T6A2_9PLEO|nr:hypothetical protein K491DRAFT_717483 [Lophiostoma macrostomum CBS 122681]